MPERYTIPGGVHRSRANKALAASCPEHSRSAWQRALDALGRDEQELLGLCDWVTKKWLLDAFAEF